MDPGTILAIVLWLIILWLIVNIAIGMRSAKRTDKYVKRGKFKFKKKDGKI